MAETPKKILTPNTSVFCVTLLLIHRELKSSVKADLIFLA